MAITDDTVARLAGLSSALAPICRGRFCDILLPNRAARTFAEDEVMYDLGDSERAFFFVRRGIVKTGTITDSGREIIYDIRKDGDVAGELCCLEPPRRDRAVAVVATEAVPVPFAAKQRRVSCQGIHHLIGTEFPATARNRPILVARSFAP